MANLTTRIQTSNGECHITLDLNINLTGGTLQATAAVEEPEDEIPYAIPDFKSDNKVKFGKQDTTTK